MDGALRMGYRGMKGHFAGVHCDRSNRGEEKTAEIDCTAYAVVVRIGSFHVFDPSSCLFRTVSSVDAGRIRHCLDVQSEMLCEAVVLAGHPGNDCAPSPRVNWKWLLSNLMPLALVRCPGDFVRDNSTTGVGVSPTERFGRF
jgi:hypothetical protein